MPYRLNTFVHVDDGENVGWFAPGDELPDWAVAAIDNPDVWDGDPPPHLTGTDDGTGRPGKTAVVADWRAYLLTLGRTEAELEGLTKAKLIELADQPVPE